MQVDSELSIYNYDTKLLYTPKVIDGVTWTTEREGTPGQLEFKVYSDDVLKFEEGNEVRFTVNGEKIFFGYVFTRKWSKDGAISVTAYDQLRYLKNKDTIVYKNKTATQLIKMIAKDYGLKTGELADTKYKIAARIEDNTTLFDMILNALYLTTNNKKQMYVLYDDFGKLTLKSIKDMKVKAEDGYLLINENSAQNFDYKSSIDEKVYNQIKLVYTNDKKKRKVYMAKDSKNIGRWGVLQLYETLQKGENGKNKAKAMLNLYDVKTQTLQLKDVTGNASVRGGSLIATQLDFGNDVVINNFMLVEKCKHEFKESEWFMDLTLRGGDINA